MSDTDTIRRQNRWLVLDVIRRLGPQSRTALATETSLSHATITAIISDMIGQQLLTDQASLLSPRTAPQSQASDARGRGRPAVRIGFVRETAYALLVEIDVSRVRCSLVDYGGTLVDRFETVLTPNSFIEMSPCDLILERLVRMRDRNPAQAELIVHIGVSVQGILDRQKHGLTWSPVAGLAGHNIVERIEAETGIELLLHKRGKLLAEGTRWLFPELSQENVATVFVGSTVAMGLSIRGHNQGRSEDSATEFGHMIHRPNGALCRCGTRGCIEAYAADYGVLRTAYGVPETTPPSVAVPAEQYEQLISLAQRGERAALHAFNLAGDAIGFGLNRLMSVYDFTHVVLVGPGTGAFKFMQREMEAALNASLTARMHGTPQIMIHGDESEPAFKGLMMSVLLHLDQNVYAGLPSPELRVGDKK